MTRRFFKTESVKSDNGSLCLKKKEGKEKKKKKKRKKRKKKRKNRITGLTAIAKRGTPQDLLEADDLEIRCIPTTLVGPWSAGLTPQFKMDTVFRYYESRETTHYHVLPAVEIRCFCFDCTDTVAIQYWQSIHQNARVFLVRIPFSIDITLSNVF